MRVVAGCARALKNPKVTWPLLNALLGSRVFYRRAATVLPRFCRQSALLLRGLSFSRGNLFALLFAQRNVDAVKVKGESSYVCCSAR